MGLQRNDFDKLPVFEECERLGEAAVRADLERAGKIFQSGSQKAAAWEWLHERANAAQERALNLAASSARWAMWAALGSLASAVATLVAAWWHR